MKSRLLYADILRVSAVAAVVFLHAAAPSEYQFNSITHSWWWVANVFDSSSRWAVPVFIMLSGMLLLDVSKTESASSFFRKRVNKVVVPFLVWSVVYSLWKVTKNGLLSHGQIQYSVIGFFVDLLRGNVYYHLGFFYYLIGLYLVTPILRVYIRNASNRNILYFLLLWVFATPLYGIIARFFHIGIAIQLPLATGFVGYFVLGHFLNSSDIRLKWRRLIYIVGIFSLLVTAYGTYFLTSSKGGTLDEYFHEYLTANVIGLSVAVFLVFKHIKWPRWISDESAASFSWRRFIVTLSGASLGVFVIHPIILEVLFDSHINYMLIHPLLGIPITAMATLIVSFAVVRIMQELPIVRRIVP